MGATSRFAVGIAVVAIAITCTNARAAFAGSVTDQVRHAQEILRDAPMVSVRCGSGRRARWCRGAIYAIESPTDGRIEVLHGPWSRQQQQFVVGRYHLTRRGPWKGINTAYEVRCTGHQRCPRTVALLAWKVPVRVRDRYRTVSHRGRVYTPASDALRVPELVRAGSNALRQHIVAERRYLDQADVRSRDVVGARVTDVVPTNVVAAIFHIEKVDDGEHRSCRGRSACVHRLMEMNLVVLGANPGRAWWFTRSRAGARGPMQFMPWTWDAIRRAYPTAELPTFMIGAPRLGESIRAAMLLIDWNLGLLDAEHRASLQQHPKALALYSAAAYNGSPRWAITAIKRCGERWTERRCRWLRRETVRYLDKVEAVWPFVGAWSLTSPTVGARTPT